MTMDVTKAIEPKSDQTNADSLLSGPRTIRIRDIAYDPTAETQKLWIYYDTDDGKPWKPCRTTARCLVAIWGPDASKWIGLSCTIYCDQDVQFGGAKVGGIRVSHMEGLDAPRTLMLTRTRGKKGATVIKPLVVDKKPAPIIDRAALKAAVEKFAKDNTGKAEWWAGLSAEEKAAVKEIANG